MTEARATGAVTASKLRPTAKEFVFNTGAPAWTPPAAFAPSTAAAAAVSTPETAAPKSSALKPSAKAFVPSFLAPAFVPATIAPPTPAAASPVAPVIVGQRSDAYVKRASSATAATSIASGCESTSTTTTTSAILTTTSTTMTTTTAKSVSSEPEAEDRTDAVAPKVEATAVVSGAVAVKEQESADTVQEPVVAAPAPSEKTPEPLLHAEATVGTNGAVQPAELPRTPVSAPPAAAPIAQEEVKKQATQQKKAVETPTTAKEAEVAAEQDVIKARIMYTIKQLLELEPETCPAPPSIKGLVVVADKTSKTSVTLAEAPSRSAGGGGGGSRGGSRRSLSRHNSSSGDNGGRGRRERGGGRGRVNHHDTAPALEDCAPLQINEETRWKPSVAKSRLDDPTDSTDASVKEAKSILNKLSVEKFDKLSDQLILVAVRGLDVLKAVIEMVIEKAQMEWHFSAMYAELCAKLAKTSMPAITLEDNEVVTDTHKLFRKLLLQRCQKEFEDKPSVDGLEELPEDERQEKELLVKRATLGHIRFVGELFKQRMLSSRIMHECISILFGDLTAPDEESLECLCKLLSTIGQALELNVREQAERDHINKYYSTIRQLGGDSKLLCTRVRFMLQDLLELRRNNWVARRKETKAMTIAEVHAEVAREAKEKEKAAKSTGSGARLQRSHSMNSTGGADRRRGSQSSSGGAASAAWKARAASSNNLAGLASASSSSTASSASTPVADDGWSTVTGGAKPKLLKSRSNSDRFLSSANAPTSGAPRHPNSARGMGSNAFASLRQDDRPSRKERARSNSASSNSSRNGSGRPPVSSSSVKSTSPSRDASAASAAPSPSTPEPLAADVFKKKAKAILEEFVELRDLDEAVASVNELNSAVHHSLIATQALNLGLDKGNKEREAVAALLAGLLDQELLSTDGLMVALDDLLEFVEDMEIDIPKTLPYLSEMLAPAVATGRLPLPRLVASVQHITYNGKAAKLVGGTLAAISDADKVRALVVVGDDGSSAIEFAALLAEHERGDEAALRTFYETYALQCLL